MMVVQNREIVPSAAKEREVGGRLYTSIIQILTVQSSYLCGAMFRVAPQKEKP